MTVHPLADLSVLDRYAAAPFPPGYPPDRRRFFSPIDNVHGALVAVISAAQRSLFIAMYGYDDDELAAVVRKLEDKNVAVQLTLDSSQAGGVHERALLAKENYPASTIAIGRSERGAIIHLKMAVVDGVIVVDGSTNWSTGGESKQDNSLLISLTATEAAVVTSRLTALHAYVQQQQRRKAGGDGSPSA
ncbi:MAG TPA: phospholipase D-like domain-containing protein [Acidimicrobiales bacterium]|nr:phospholipase D-like domain-containing protein [Acidimicrobiales bacterium]